MTATLMPDSSYRLRRTYLEADNGRDRTFVEAGRWSRSTDGRRIALLGDGEPTLLAVAGPDRLDLLDREGRPISSAAPHTLTRAAEVDPIPALAAPLEDTRWKLVWLAESSSAPDSQREAWITLASQEGRASGSTGCNRLSGAYRTVGDSLSFGAMAMTRMACPGMGDQEQVFTRALEATRRFAVQGDTLELHDGADRALARLVRSTG
jgi:putative lipoprotein